MVSPLRPAQASSLGRTLGNHLINYTRRPILVSSSSFSSWSPSSFRRHRLNGSYRSIQTSAHTLISPTPSSLTSFLTTVHPCSTYRNSTHWLYLASTSLSSLPTLLPILQSLPNSIGSFHITPPGTEPTLSLARFDADHDLSREKTSEKGTIKIFRSDLVGRGEAEVGRWQRPNRPKYAEDERGQKEGEMDEIRSEQGWAGLWEPTAGGGVGPTGKRKDRLPDLVDVNAKSFIILSDSTPYPLLSALQDQFPNSNPVGLITAPTPFLTGRPHTLLHNDKIYSSGAVGLAFEGNLDTLVDYGVKPLIDEIYTIDAAQGNMLLRLSGSSSNPTQTLISGIHDRDALSRVAFESTTPQILGNKDENFYLLLVESGQVVKILSGDPSRGAISLDTQESIRSGQRVQFMQSGRKSTSPTLGMEILSNRIGFGVLPRAETENVLSGQPRVLDGFLAMSELGVIGRRSVCTVAGAIATVRY